MASKPTSGSRQMGLDTTALDLSPLATRRSKASRPFREFPHLSAVHDTPPSAPPALPILRGRIEPQIELSLREYLRTLPAPSSTAKGLRGPRNEWLFADVNYAYSGRIIRPCAPFKVVERFALDIVAKHHLRPPNACLLVHYPQGTTGLNLHRDDEPAHASEQVITVSMGARATLVLKTTGQRTPVHHTISHGDYYVFVHQADFKHGVTNIQDSKKGRWALTFRIFHPSSIIRSPSRIQAKSQKTPSSSVTTALVSKPSTKGILKSPAASSVKSSRTSTMTTVTEKNPVTPTLPNPTASPSSASEPPTENLICLDTGPRDSSTPCLSPKVIPFTSTDPTIHELANIFAEPAIPFRCFYCEAPFMTLQLLSWHTWNIHGILSSSLPSSPDTNILATTNRSPLRVPESPTPSCVSSGPINSSLPPPVGSTKPASPIVAPSYASVASSPPVVSPSWSSPHDSPPDQQSKGKRVCFTSPPDHIGTSFKKKRRGRRSNNPLEPRGKRLPKPICSVCGIKFPRPSDMMEHYVISHRCQTLPLACGGCGGLLDNPTQISSHLRTCKLSPSGQLSTTNQDSTSKVGSPTQTPPKSSGHQALDSPILRRPSGKKLFRCKLCNEPFYSTQGLKNHTELKCPGVKPKQSPNSPGSQPLSTSTQKHGPSSPASSPVRNMVSSSSPVRKDSTLNWVKVGKKITNTRVSSHLVVTGVKPDFPSDPNAARTRPIGFNPKDDTTPLARNENKHVVSRPALGLVPSTKTNTMLESPSPQPRVAVLTPSVTHRSPGPTSDTPPWAHVASKTSKQGSDGCGPGSPPPPPAHSSPVTERLSSEWVAPITQNPLPSGTAGATAAFGLHACRSPSGTFSPFSSSPPPNIPRRKAKTSRPTNPSGPSPPSGTTTSELRAQDLKQTPLPQRIRTRVRRALKNSKRPTTVSMNGHPESTELPLMPQGFSDPPNVTTKLPASPTADASPSAMVSTELVESYSNLATRCGTCLTRLPDDRELTKHLYTNIGCMTTLPFCERCGFASPLDLMILIRHIKQIDCTSGGFELPLPLPTPPSEERIITSLRPEDLLSQDIGCDDLYAESCLAAPCTPSMSVPASTAAPCLTDIAEISSYDRACSSDPPNIIHLTLPEAPNLNCDMVPETGVDSSLFEIVDEYDEVDITDFIDAPATAPWLQFPATHHNDISAPIDNPIDSLLDIRNPKGHVTFQQLDLTSSVVVDSFHAASPPAETEPSTASYKCDNCGAILRTKTALKNHKTSTCTKIRVRCEYCTKTIIGRRNLRHHHRTDCMNRRALEIQARLDACLITVQQVEDETVPADHSAPPPQDPDDAIVITVFPEENVVQYHFPFPSELSCPISACNKRYSGETWSSIKASVGRHLKTFHGLSFDSCNFCNICNSRITERLPSQHSCLRFAVMRRVTPQTLQHLCDVCLEAFASHRGLLNHIHLKHRKTDAAKDALGSTPSVGPIGPRSSRNQPNRARNNLSKQTARSADVETLVRESEDPAPPPTSPLRPQPAHRPVFHPDSPLTPFLSLLDAVAQDPDPGLAFDDLNNLHNLIIEKVHAHHNIQDIAPAPSGNHPDPEDQSFIQRSYKRFRRRAVRLILEGDNERCKIPKSQIFDHFSAPPPRDPLDTRIFDTPGVAAAPQEVLMEPFSPQEVCRRLSRFENSAPGPDRIQYRHWKSIDPEGACLTALFNVILKLGRVPTAWKRSHSILLYKKGDKESLASWRPIALSNTLSKVFSGLLAERFSTWLENNEVLHPSQKGFLPFDGVFEHNFMLQSYLLRARDDGRQAFVGWLDFRDAFGSLRHEVILHALSSYGAGQAFAEMVAELYTGVETSFITAEGLTPSIPKKCGVLQGDPLSGLLFILSIDPVLWYANPDTDRRRLLSYADDISPIASCAEELQQLITNVEVGGRAIGLSLNPTKCRTYHHDPSPPAGCRPTVFKVGGQDVLPLRDGQYEEYLGKPVGFLHKSTVDQSFASLAERADKIINSKLAPWQKLDAIKTFVFPTFTFAYRTERYNKTSWGDMDRHLRPAIKKALSLPPHATNSYLYAEYGSGALGIPLAAEDSDLFLIDNAYKLLTSTDPVVAEAAYEDLLHHCQRRTGAALAPDPAAFLSGYNEGIYALMTNSRHSVWSAARAASSRNRVTWSFSNQTPSLSCQDPTGLYTVNIHYHQRRQVASLLRAQMRKSRTDKLLACPSQGKTFHLLSHSRASSFFLHSGRYVRFTDYRFIHKARTNTIALNGTRAGSRSAGSLRCPRCLRDDETLPHVVGHCNFGKQGIINRHNMVQQRLIDLLKNQGEVLGVGVTTAGIPSLQGVAGVPRLMPDITFSSEGVIYLIDVTIPFENGPDSFDVARRNKTTKYEPVRRAIAKHTRQPCVIVPFTVGALGAWDPQNEPFLRKFASRSYIKMFRELCVAEVVRGTTDIFNAHRSGQKIARLAAYQPEDNPPDEISSSPAPSQPLLSQSEPPVSLQVLPSQQVEPSVSVRCQPRLGDPSDLPLGASPGRAGDPSPSGQPSGQPSPQ